MHLSPWRAGSQVGGRGEGMHTEVEREEYVPEVHLDDMKVIRCNLRLRAVRGASLFLYKEGNLILLERIRFVWFCSP